MIELKNKMDMYLCMLCMLGIMVNYSSKQVVKYLIIISSLFFLLTYNDMYIISNLPPMRGGSIYSFIYLFLVAIIVVNIFSQKNIHHEKSSLNWY